MGYEMDLLEREMRGIEKDRQEARAEYEAENAKLKAQIAELQQYKQKYDKIEAKFNNKKSVSFQH